MNPALAKVAPDTVSDWLVDADAAIADIEALYLDATASVRNRVSDKGALSLAKFEAEQHAVHGLAWLATYAQALREMVAYAKRMGEEGRFGESETLLTRIGLGEYLAQVFGGIPMSQGEIVRLADFGLSHDAIAKRHGSATDRLIADGNTVAHRARLAVLIDQAGPSSTFGDPASMTLWNPCARKCTNSRKAK